MLSQTTQQKIEGDFFMQRKSKGIMGIELVFVSAGLLLLGSSTAYASNMNDDQSTPTTSIVTGQSTQTQSHQTSENVNKYAANSQVNENSQKSHNVQLTRDDRSEGTFSPSPKNDTSGSKHSNIQNNIKEDHYEITNIKIGQRQKVLKNSKNKSGVTQGNNSTTKENTSSNDKNQTGDVGSSVPATNSQVNSTTQTNATQSSSNSQPVLSVEDARANQEAENENIRLQPDLTQSQINVNQAQAEYDITGAVSNVVGQGTAIVNSICEIISTIRTLI